jgi:hypothetical protein
MFREDGRARARPSRIARKRLALVGPFSRIVSMSCRFFDIPERLAVLAQEAENFVPGLGPMRLGFFLVLTV